MDTIKDLSQDDLDRLLYDAVIKNDLERVELFIENGANIMQTNFGGTTLLICAVRAGSIAMAEKLIELSPNLLNAFDESGCCALMSAINAGQTEMVALLIKHHVNIKIVGEFERNVLIFAAIKGHIEIVKLLIDCGMNIEAGDIDEKNALMHAAENGHIKVVQLLIQLGANVNAKSNVKNKTVIMYAARAGQTVAVDLLIKAGANIKEKDSDGLTAFNHGQEADKEFTLYRLMSCISPEECTVFSSIGARIRFKNALKESQKKIYLFLKNDYQIFDPNKESLFSMLPAELINLIKVLELQLQDFPDWYQHRVVSDRNLLIRRIPQKEEKDIADSVLAEAPVLITQAYDVQKRKSGDNQKQDNQYEQDIHNNVDELQKSISNMKLN